MSLDDPQLSDDRAARQRRNQGANDGIQLLWRRTTRPEDRNAGILIRRKEERVREVQVEGDQASLFAPADRDDLFVGGTGETLVRHRHDIMSRVEEELPTPLTEVL